MLSELQQILIGGLKICGLNQDDIVAVMTLLNTEELQWAMADYLEEAVTGLPGKTEVFKKAAELAV